MFQSRAHARWRQLSQGGDGDLRTIAARWLEGPEPDDGTAAVEAIKLRFAIDRALWAFDRWLESEARLVDAILGSRDAAAEPAAKGYPEYNRNQPRNDLGRWARPGGAMETLLADRRGGRRTVGPAVRARPEDRLRSISPLLDAERMKPFAGRALQGERRRREMQEFLDALDSQGLRSTTEEKALFAFIFAAEGGIDGKGGMTDGFFRELGRTRFLRGEGVPKSRARITAGNLPALYRQVEAYFTRNIGGPARLVEIRDEKLRIAFIDAQFVDGFDGGGSEIRQAINEVLHDPDKAMDRARTLAKPLQDGKIPGDDNEPRSLSPVDHEAFDAFKALANSGDPKIVQRLRDALAAARIGYRAERRLLPPVRRILHLAEPDPVP